MQIENRARHNMHRYVQPECQHSKVSQMAEAVPGGLEAGSLLEASLHLVSGLPMDRQALGLRVEYLKFSSDELLLNI